MREVFTLTEEQQRMVQFLFWKLLIIFHPNNTGTNVILNHLITSMWRWQNIRYRNVAASWSYCGGKWNKVVKTFPGEKHQVENNTLMLFVLIFQGTNISLTLKVMSSFSVCFPQHADTLLWEMAQETNILPHTNTHTHTFQKKTTATLKETVIVHNLIHFTLCTLCTQIY